MNTKIIEQRILTPDEGKVLTNGDAYVETAVVLPADADYSVWSEILKEDVPKDGAIF